MSAVIDALSEECASFHQMIGPLNLVDVGLLTFMRCKQRDDCFFDSPFSPVLKRATLNCRTFVLDLLKQQKAGPEQQDESQCVSVLMTYE